jgi:hypothetical protein
VNRHRIVVRVEHDDLEQPARSVDRGRSGEISELRWRGSPSPEHLTIGWRGSGERQRVRSPPRQLRAQNAGYVRPRRRPRRVDLCAPSTPLPGHRSPDRDHRETSSRVGPRPTSSHPVGAAPSMPFSVSLASVMGPPFREWAWDHVGVVRVGGVMMAAGAAGVKDDDASGVAGGSGRGHFRASGDARRTRRRGRVRVRRLEPVDGGLGEERVGHQRQPLDRVTVARDDGGRAAAPFHDELVLAATGPACRRRYPLLESSCPARLWASLRPGGLGRVSYRAGSQMKMLRTMAPPRKITASLS